MADIIDQAQELEEMHREVYLASRVRIQRETADNCVECGYQIPSARQVALPGVQTCVDCAELLE